MITHTIGSYRIPSQNKTKSNLQISRICQHFKHLNSALYRWHTFWSCVKRCVTMKWMRLVLLKIQSRHDSVHRGTDRQMDRWTRWNQYTPHQLRWAMVIINLFCFHLIINNSNWCSLQHSISLVAIGLFGGVKSQVMDFNWLLNYHWILLQCTVHPSEWWNSLSIPNAIDSPLHIFKSMWLGLRNGEDG